MILNTFLMILYMYIAPGQGQATPWGQTFDANRKPLSLCPFVASFKKIALKSDFIYILFFMFHHMYIAPGRGRQSIGEKSLMTTERPFPFAHMLHVSKWSLQNLILYTFLMTLYMYIAPGQGQKTPWGQTFDVNRKPLSLQRDLFQVSNRSLWILILYTYFNIFPHVYSPGAGADNPLWTKSWCQQKSHFAHLLQASKIYLWSLILYRIFSCFYTCI